MIYALRTLEGRIVLRTTSKTSAMALAGMAIFATCEAVQEVFGTWQIITPAPQQARHAYDGWQRVGG
jgi:hypothetical protein